MRLVSFRQKYERCLTTATNRNDGKDSFWRFVVSRQFSVRYLEDTAFAQVPVATATSDPSALTDRAVTSRSNLMLRK